MLDRIPDVWRRPLAVTAIACVAMLLLFHRDVFDLVDQWWNSSTFNHCLIIVPIIGWLIVIRAGELAKLTPSMWWPGLVWIAGGACAWLLGDAASVSLFRQLGLVVMLQGLVPTVLGPQVTRGLLFPLFYSFFLIPFGEELVPPMQTLTADMSMGMLAMAGIPAHIEGIFITTPGGYFAVAEACSGVKFLVAMLALSVLAAHLCFHSWWRRAVFMLVALIIPVIANGFRAFSTMWIAEHWGIEFAASADHVVYGWVFFGIVIALVGLLFWPWFDRYPDDVPIDGDALARFMPTTKGAPAALILPLLAGLVVAGPAWSRIAAAQVDPVTLAAPAPIAEWTLGPRSSDWAVQFDGAGARRDWSWQGADGARVDATLVAYPRQQDGAEMVGYGQGAVAPNSDWRWSEDLPDIGKGAVARIMSFGQPRDVLTVYRIAGAVTSSPRQVKLLALKARFTGGDERGYALVLAARPAGQMSGRDQIDRLVRDAGGVDALLTRLTTAQ